MRAAAIFDELRAAGITFRADTGSRLIVAPANRLNDEQRSLVRQHKAALLRLLDAETLLQALTTAGPASLDWREGTPPDWSDNRLLDAGEALYSDGRMANVLGRRYLTASAPRMLEQGSGIPSPQTTPQSAPSVTRNGIAIGQPPAPASDRTSPLHREEGDNPQAARIAELMVAGWSPWNAKARAESEALPGWQHPP